MLLKPSSCVSTELTRPFSSKHIDTTSLTSMSQDYEFLTHFALFRFTTLQADPIQLFFSENNLKYSAIDLIFDIAIFDGLNKWNNHLIAIPKEHYQALLQYLDNIVITDIERGLFIRMLRQQLPLFDPYHNIPSRVNISTYGLDGNKQCIHFVPAKTPLDPITLKIDKPLPNTIQHAETIFKHIS